MTLAIIIGTLITSCGFAALWIHRDQIRQDTERRIKTTRAIESSTN